MPTLRRSSLSALLFAGLVLAPGGSRADAAFQPLGDLPGGATASSALGISADGRVVVGQSESANGPEAFRWRADQGLEGLGDLPGGGFESMATGASADGSVIVGQGTSDLLVSGFGFRWTEAGGLVALGGPFLAEETSGSAKAVSGDGDLVVGEILLSDCDYEWTPATGIVSACNLLPGLAEIVRDNAVSTDGSAVAGYTFNHNGDGDSLAHRNYLPVPVDNNPFQTLLGGEVFGASADGSVLVGQFFELFNPFTRTGAFRWEAGHEEGLGTLGGDLGRALDVSGDGATVVGWSDTATGREAFLWDAAGGMRSLQSELEGVYGLDLSGWTLDEAAAISDDGLVVVGTGTNPVGDSEGFAAFFVTACSNGMDDDGDGAVDGADTGCDGAADISEHAPGVDCDDGVDNDGDGAADYPDDPACKSAFWGPEDPACQNGLDDDGDGTLDFDGGAAANGGVPLGAPDPQCGAPWRATEERGRGCGLGVEAGLALLLLLPFLRRRG